MPYPDPVKRGEKLIRITDEFQLGKFQLLTLLRKLPDDALIEDVKRNGDALDIKVSSRTFTSGLNEYMSEYFFTPTMTETDVENEINFGKRSTNSTTCHCWLEYTGERVHKSICPFYYK